MLSHVWFVLSRYEEDIDSVDFASTVYSGFLLQAEHMNRKFGDLSEGQKVPHALVSYALFARFMLFVLQQLSGSRLFRSFGLAEAWNSGSCEQICFTVIICEPIIISASFIVHTEIICEQFYASLSKKKKNLFLKN